MLLYALRLFLETLLEFGVQAVFLIDECVPDGNLFIAVTNIKRLQMKDMTIPSAEKAVRVREQKHHFGHGVIFILTLPFVLLMELEYYIANRRAKRELKREIR